MKGRMSEGVIIMTETWEERQRALKVLEAAVAEAAGRPNEPVFALPVMRRASVSNEEFRTTARYLDEKGWIAESGGDYEAFAVTPEGVDRVTGGRGEIPTAEGPEPDNDGDEEDGKDD